MKYTLPAAFEVHFQTDPVLKQLREDGEEHNRPVSELFKAATAYLLDSRRYLFIELGRYIQQYGHLEPLEFDTSENQVGENGEGIPYNEEENGNTTTTTQAEEEIHTQEFTPLTPLPKCEEEPKKRFTKTYNDEERS